MVIYSTNLYTIQLIETMVDLRKEKKFLIIFEVLKFSKIVFDNESVNDFPH